LLRQVSGKPDQLQKLQGSLPAQLTKQPGATFEVGIGLNESDAKPCVEAAIEDTGGMVLHLTRDDPGSHVLFAELSGDGILSIAGRADVASISLNRDPEAPPPN